MKKISTVLSMILISVMVLSFSSCDSDDVDEAYNLNGYWKGQITGNYYTDRYGNEGATYYDSEISFSQDGDFSNGGTGYEMDYNQDDENDNTYSEFDWAVRNGNIYISYADGYDVIIYDYELYDGYFRGSMENAKNGNHLADFNLIKTSDWPWSRSITKNAGAKTVIKNVPLKTSQVNK